MSSSLIHSTIKNKKWPLAYFLCLKMKAALASRLLSFRDSFDAIPKAQIGQ